MRLVRKDPVYHVDQTGASDSMFLLFSFKNSST